MGVSDRIAFWSRVVFLPVLVSCGARSTEVADADADGDTDTDVDSDVDTDVDSDTDGDLCEADPLAPGCPCDALEPEACYDGPAGTRNVGACRDGLRTCARGAWSECEGQQLPGVEVCDELDNDCDGEVDEGVTNECGTCDPECELGLCVGLGHDLPFAPTPERSSGVAVDDDGALVLAEGVAEGEWRWVLAGFEVCTGTAVWFSLDWNADVPPSASLGFDVRGAIIQGDLELEDWTAVGNVPPDEPPADIDSLNDEGGCGQPFIEIRVRLSGDDIGTTPRLHSLCVHYACTKVIC